MLETIVAVSVVFVVLVIAGSAMGNNVLSIWTTRDPDIEPYRGFAPGPDVDGDADPERALRNGGHLPGTSPVA